MGGDNLYQYAINPTAWVDPLGLNPNKQGLYVLRDKNCNIKYVGRGNVADRLKKHAKDHSELTPQVIHDTGDLTYAEAKGLEAKVMGKFGGPSVTSQ